MVSWYPPDVAEPAGPAGAVPAGLLPPGAVLAAEADPLGTPVDELGVVLGFADEPESLLMMS